jgi:hypothetical protein
MSNQFAIAAVTRTLWNLLNQITTIDFSAVPTDARPTAQIEVTTLPLDSVSNDNNNINRVNLFLYHTEPNAAWRNMDIPQRIRPGETGYPPLALNLYYIVTAYGQDNSELIAHLLLGAAMRILHDHAVLSRDEIELTFAASALHEQLERVRITPQPVSLDDISKLWTGFQSEYRLSAAYQVSVVLIDSTRPQRSPLPVLQRGVGDRGVYVVAMPPPALRAVDLPNRKASAELGDTLRLVGEHLDGDALTVRFRHARLEEARERLPLAGSNATQMQVRLPDITEDPTVPSTWPAGVYMLSLVVQRPALPAWTTNAIPFALAPQITSLAPQMVPQASVPFTLTVTCSPQVRAVQRAVLLFSDREIQATTITTPADPTAATSLTFTVRDVVAGVYVVRLRVDGVDSIPVDFTTTPPQFDAAQRVTITP